MKRVLIITYYWPPYAGSGVYRWLKFVKYLRHYNWEPIVYTPENPEAPEIDESLLKDIPQNLTVIKRRIWEPYNLYKKFIGQKKDQKIYPAFLSETKKPRLTEKISVWLRGNLFIPDARRFWIKPSVRFLIKYLKENPVNIIVSTGPPHSMHLIALKIKKELNIPWLTDFRDPWTNIYFYKDLMLTRWADKKHHHLEQQVIRNADCLITVGKTFKKEFIEFGAKNVVVIPNGYDTDDFPERKLVLDKKFTLTYVGTLVKDENPVLLWRVLSGIIKEVKDFADDLEIKLVGRVDFSVNESLDKYDIVRFVKKTGFCSHSEVSKILQKSQVLLLLISQARIIPGKVFEYLASRRPILAIGHTNGDVAELLNETQAGKIVDFNDESNIKKLILEYYTMYKNNNLFCQSRNVEKYSRRVLTECLAEVLNKYSLPNSNF